MAPPPMRKTPPKNTGRPRVPLDAESQTWTNRFLTSCFAWIILVLAFLLLVSFIILGIYYSIVQSNLPEAHFHRLDVDKLNVTSHTEKGALLITDILIYLNVTNRSTKLELDYGPMVATLGAQGINFQSVKIEKMRQSPSGSTDLKIRFSDKRVVEDELATQMQESARKHIMMVNMIVKGHLDFLKNGTRIQGFPFKVDCSATDQYLVDSGSSPKCTVKISLLP